MKCKTNIMLALCWLGFIFAGRVLSHELHETPVYNRADWGGWIDVDSDCQDSREEILIRDAGQLYNTLDACVIDDGVWFDPYSGEVFKDPAKMDIDHIIPLKHAHDMGGWAWSSDKKREFANDLENLIAVSASENRSKGSRGPGEWMPKNKEFWCEYVERWTYLKKKYNLPLTVSEDIVIRVVVRTCD
jgi:5-methylcytosine-specific restriction endonuclease McrA